MLIYLITFGFLALSTLCIILLLVGYRTKPRPPTEIENFYHLPASEKGNEKERLPLITDPAQTDLTVVIPAYNEIERLPLMLEDSITYLKSHQIAVPGFSFELLVVDDGSKDGTAKVAMDFAKDNGLKKDELRVMRNEINRGKGGSVTQGMLHAKGKRILFADADGATKFSDIKLLLEKLDAISVKGKGLVVGSRSHLKNSDAVVKRSFLRNLLMYGFHAYLYALGVRGISDTQCGFKLFTREAASRIFFNMHVEGWIFDIEALILASKFQIPVGEAPVNWQEIDGSKVSIIRDAIKMALDLLMIRLSYFWGVWRIQLPTPSNSPTLANTRL